jgi:hypothetical protein
MNVLELIKVRVKKDTLVIALTFSFTSSYHVY